MASIIDLSRITPEPNNYNYAARKYEKPPEPHLHEETIFNKITQEKNEQMLQRIFPDKLLFTIKETASLLNVSYEYIRQQIIKHLIPAIGFGDRKMIHRNTIIELLTIGVNNGQYS